MAFAGLRGTGDWATDERPKDFREYILWRQPNGTAPLTALLSKMKKQSTSDPEFNWWEEELNSVRIVVNYTTGYSTTDNTIVVDGSDALELVAGDILLVEKAITTAYNHELVVVSSVTDANTIVLKRAQVNTSAAPLANDTALTKIGNAYAEGTTSPNVSQRNPTKLYNYAQIFKTAYEITGTAEQTQTRTGDPVKNDKKRKMFDHADAMEMAFLFGKRYETTGSNNKPLRFTGGLLYMLSQYASTRITAFTSAPTEDDFLEVTYPIWDYNTEAGNERLCFAGNGALNYLNKLARNSSSSRINFNGYVSAYGMKLAEWILPQGTIYIKTHPKFNTHARFTKDMFIFDPTAMVYRYVRNRDTKFQDNIQANDADTRKGQWIGECGLEMQHAKTSCWISNLPGT